MEEKERSVVRKGRVKGKGKREESMGREEGKEKEKAGGEGRKEIEKGKEEKARCRVKEGRKKRV